MVFKTIFCLISYTVKKIQYSSKLSRLGHCLFCLLQLMTNLTLFSSRKDNIMFVRSFVCSPFLHPFCSSLSRAINLQYSGSDYCSFLLAVSQQSLSSLSALSQQFLSCLSAVSQLSLSCLSAVSQQSLSTHSAVS